MILIFHFTDMLRYFVIGSLLPLSLSLMCRKCSENLLPLEACNSTHCVIDCDVKVCNVGLCFTKLKTNHETGHLVSAIPICQV